MKSFQKHSRKYLNKKYGLASIEWEVGVSNNGKRVYAHQDLSISDCSRMITLDFDLGTEEYTKRSFHKINLLIDELSRFREAMVEARKIIEESKLEKSILP